MDEKWLIRKFLEDQAAVDLRDERLHIWEERLVLVEMVEHEISGEDYWSELLAGQLALVVFLMAGQREIAGTRTRWNSASAGPQS